MKYLTFHGIVFVLISFFLISCENGLAPPSDITDANSNDITDDCSAKIGDFIWLDDDLNGLQGENETGLAGIIMYLLNADSVVIDTTVSDTNGFYQFKELCFNDYYVQYDSENLKIEYKSTITLQGNDFQKDSNLNLAAVTIEDKFTIVTDVDFGFAVDQDEEDNGEDNVAEEDGDNDDNGENDEDDNESDETTKEEAYGSMIEAYNIIVEIYALIESTPDDTDLYDVWIALAYAIEKLAAANEAYESENYDTTKELADGAAALAEEALTLLQTILNEASYNEETENNNNENDANTE
ncbi:SdrD B-like domain-containing protein [Candidatus Neomarinimicrobiota bacterium]